jgi:hypothetical protein
VHRHEEAVVEQKPSLSPATVHSLMVLAALAAFTVACGQERPAQTERAEKPAAALAPQR